MTDFKARRPIIKNLIRLFISLAVSVCLVLIFQKIYIEDPLTFNEKLTSCVIFCVFIIWEVFSLSFFADSLRNLLAPSTILIKDGALKVFGYPQTMVADIEKTEMTDISKNPKKKSPAIAVYLKGAEEPIIIKKNLTGIPLDTVKYAIDTRLENK